MNAARTRTSKTEPNNLYSVFFFPFLFEEKNNEPWGMATIAFSKGFAALSVPLVGDILNALF